MEITAMDEFFILLVQVFESMSDEELYEWSHDNIPVSYVRRIVAEIRRELL